jgi:hypothetical protein
MRNAIVRIALNQSFSLARVCHEGSHSGKSKESPGKNRICTGNGVESEKPAKHLRLMWYLCRTARQVQEWRMAVGRFRRGSQRFRSIPYSESAQ